MNMAEHDYLNYARISGILAENLQYSHQTLGESFFTARVMVHRISGIVDMVPIIISEDRLRGGLAVRGSFVEITGEVRSHSKLGKDGIYHLTLYVFVKEIEFCEPREEVNEISLIGLVCKQPIYRLTPLGKEICDLFIVAYRRFEKYDYLPCICWGSMAQNASNLKLGDRVEMYGRFQSREYLKRPTPESENGEIRTAYELSMYKVIE